MWTIFLKKKHWYRKNLKDFAVLSSLLKNQMETQQFAFSHDLSRHFIHNPMLYCRYIASSPNLPFASSQNLNYSEIR